MTVDPEVVADLEKKLEKISTGAVDALKDMDHEELTKHLATLAEHEVETRHALKNNDEIQRLKSNLSERQAPFNETLKGVALRRQLTVLYRATRGVPVSK